MNLIKITIVGFAFLFASNIHSQQNQDTISTTNNKPVDVTIVDGGYEKQVPNNVNIDTTGEFNLLIKDSQILITLDKLLYDKFYKKSFFTVDTSGKFNNEFRVDEIPAYADSIYDQRIKALNRETPIELTYNKEVKSYINLYAVKKRELTAKMLGLSEIYFPMFEEALDKYDMPLEIKYLAIVESALNPAAGSNKGAKGLWQFMYGTGKVYGLKVTSLIDDRYDPYKSTIAACEHLGDLYDIYGTPVIYVLDRDKKIIAKRIGANKIAEFVKNFEKQ